MNASITITIPNSGKHPELVEACVDSLRRPCIISPWTESFARTVNNGLRGANTDFVAQVNADTISPPGWELILESFDDPSVGLLCPKEGDLPIYDPYGDIIHGPGGFFGGFWVMRTSLWEKLGGMDERFVPYYCEDADLMWRTEQAGFKIVQDHRIIIRHLQSFFINQDKERESYMEENCKRFREKHGFDPRPYQHP